MFNLKPNFFVEALLSLRPDSSFIIRGNLADYDSIEWAEENIMSKPTQEELEAEMQRLEDEWTAKEYQRFREQEYPDFREYLDGIVKGDQEQIQDYINKCLAVKAKYPKPE